MIAAQDMLAGRWTDGEAVYDTDFPPSGASGPCPIDEIEMRMDSRVIGDFIRSFRPARIEE